MRIALVSREFHPFSVGGIAPIVAAAVARLASVADVTVVTSGEHRERYERMRRTGDPRLPPDSVRMRFADTPDERDIGGFNAFMHAYSASVHRTLRAEYGDRGPDVIEFCDYLGEGFVTIQDRHTGARWLEDTLVCVRLHTTSEMCNVLDGHVRDDFATEVTYDLERYALHRADRLLWSGGDIRATYERFYGRDRLAPSILLRDAFLLGAGNGGVETGASPTEGPLRLLYLGRLERRKGVQNLVRGLLSLGRDDWRLTLLGGDTATGPLAVSMRDQLELMVADDHRVTFVDPVDRADVGAVIARHDVVVVPSLWECWPNVAREALRHNRPILATPVGGLVDMAVPDRSGWLTRDTSPEALAGAVQRLLENRKEVTKLIVSRGPQRHFAKLTDEAAFVEGYLELAAASPAAPQPRARVSGAPLVSVIVPYFRLEEHVEETLDSVEAQTHPRVEVVLVNDGSLREDDRLLLDLAERPGVRLLTQANSGLGAARNFGVLQARGRFVLPLDADDVIAPEFVERCVHALQRDEELAYATSWVRYMDNEGVPLDDERAGYMPLGNWSRAIRRSNVGGTCTSVFPRRVFERGFAYSPDLTSYEDWLLYWVMHEAGLHGAVIPERLLDYRVRSASMMRSVGQPLTERLYGELRAHVRERTMNWTAGAK